MGMSDFFADGGPLDPAVLERMALAHFPEWQQEKIPGDAGEHGFHAEQISNAYQPLSQAVLPADHRLPKVEGSEAIRPQLLSHTAAGMFDIAAIRGDFPILAEMVAGKPLIWLDNAATTQKPACVIERLAQYYRKENSNIHRAAHTLAAKATDGYEEARGSIARFVGASSADEIVFVRGATEAVNLVAQTYGRMTLRPGDEVAVSLLEHHANIVPWQMICGQIGAGLRVLPVDKQGQVDLAAAGKIIGSRTKIVALGHVSNALGTITPVREIAELAHRHDAVVLVDGAQSIPHLPIDVGALDCDFFVFSGHKLFGPTGIGVLYGKEAYLREMPPYQGGGNMIADVSFGRTIYRDPPHRFEAGTGNIAAAIGLGEAVKYLSQVGMDNIACYEQQLLAYGTEAFLRVPGLRLIGTAKEKTGILSFVMEGFSIAEIGRAVSAAGIAVRAGHHCAQPIVRFFGLEGTVRPSLAFYNTKEELDELAAVLKRLRLQSHVF